MANRIRLLRERAGWTLQQLADNVEPRTTRQTILRLENGDRRLTQDWMERIAEALDCAPAELFQRTETSAISSAGGASVAVDLRSKTADALVDVAGDSYFFVPAYDVRAAAGAGALGHSEAAIYRLPFRLHWLGQVTKSPPNRLAVIQIDGDSMQPTLMHGDHVLIDRGDTAAGRDGIYVLDLGDGLVVKRTTVNPATARLTIGSDNPAYQTFTDIDPSDVHFAGRVIWIGRRV